MLFQNDEMMEFKDYRILKYIGVGCSILLTAVTYFISYILLGKYYLIDVIRYIEVFLLISSLLLASYSLAVTWVHSTYNVREHTIKENNIYLAVIFTSAQLTAFISGGEALIGFIVKHAGNMVLALLQ